MSAFRTLDELDVRGKRVLLRVDLNVPMENGRVADLTRIERVAPTIIEIADKGGKVILLSHLGRPKGPDPKDSLKPVAGAVISQQPSRLEAAEQLRQADGEGSAQYRAHGMANTADHDGG